MNLNKLIKDLEIIFGGRQQALWVLEKITGLFESEIISKESLELSKEQQEKLSYFIEKTKQNYPLQYLLESVPFLDLEISVRPPILIPRPETEQWVADLIKRLRPKLKILDLCTGSGCIAMALAKNFPDSFVYGVDISQACIDLASENKIKNNIENIELVLSDLYKNLNLNFKFDLIVANPPYISESDFKDLQPEVKLWEDKKALVANNNGLEIIEKIISGAKNYLNINSELKKIGLNQIYIEIGHNQGKEVKNIFEKNNFSNITIIKDLNKKDRVVSAGV